MSEKLTEELLTLMKICGYSEKVIKYFKNKVNMGRVESPGWVSEHTGFCGDKLQIYLKINNGFVEDARFLYVVCLGVCVSASTITAIVKKKLRSFKKGSPRFNSMIDGIIQKIEKYQSARYRGYIKRFYECKISGITAMISRLKVFMSARVVYVE